ncbi:hypothetical protein A5634_03265 [Mycobacterium asiaticum]|uniref:Peptidase C14 caspase domain-containing protein n=1 Tax=Mycobacterium asiaticum TaxID=1790 RepID=A0A1A3NQK1_MYCAS|nr:caspase family protein [Mycobacterium asiaticum]OBK24368.1 hypothetical protein A5634_03265 [Mycobacterium asiaticum]
MRFLLTCALSKITQHPDINRPELAEDVARMAALFCGATDENPEAYHHVRITAAGRSPAAQTLLHGLRKFARERTKQDYVVVYLTGHGYIRVDDHVHVLLTNDSDTSDLHIRTVKLSDIVELLLAGTEIRRLLLILDTCYAGEGGESAVADAIRRLDGPKYRDDTGVVVIESARPTERAHPGLFTQCLQRAMESEALAGSAVPWLDLPTVMEAIKADPLRKLSQSPRWHLLASPGRLPDFLPNPRFRAALVDSDLLDQDRLLTAERRGDAVVRFSPAARWFTGRHAALEAISGWLPDGSQPQCLVVTGNAGSGKSALLAVIALLDDPLCAASVPQGGLPAKIPVGRQLISYVIDVATLTTGKVLDQFCQRFGSRSTALSDLLAAIRVGEAVTVLIDSLDEAADPPDLVQRVLLPLIAGTGGSMRFLLGTRPAVLSDILRPAITPEARAEVDLDDERYADPDSIRSHVFRILRSDDAMDSSYKPSGVYRTAPASQVQGVAAAIADAAGTSFLIARIIATTESTRTYVADPNDETWRATLPRRAADAMQRDLEVRLGPDAALARRLLLPLAYAQASGLPWEDIWPQLAQRLTPGEPVTIEEMIWMRRAAGSYVVEGDNGGRSVYRLYHRSLADYLLEQRDTRADHRTIAKTLLAAVPYTFGAGRDWTSVHPYLTDHLPTHAARGGVLDDLLTDPGFLQVANVISLLDVASSAKSDEAKLAARAYERAAIRQPNEPEALHIAALQVGAEPLAQLLRQSHTAQRRRWCPKWGFWAQGRDAGRSVGEPGEPARWVLAVPSVDEPAVVVVGVHRVEYWTLHPPGCQAVKVFDEAVSCAGMCSWDGRPAVAVGRHTGQVDFYALPDLHPVTGWPAHQGCVQAIAGADDQPWLITGDDHGTIRVWSVPGLVQLCEKVNAHNNIRRMQILTLDRGPILISCGDALPLSGHRDDLPTVAAWELPSLKALASHRRDDNNRFIVGVDAVISGEIVRILAHYTGRTDVLTLQHTDAAAITVEDEIADIATARGYISLRDGAGILCRNYDLLPIQFAHESGERIVVDPAVEMDPQWWCGPFLINGEEFLAGCDRTLRLWRTSRIVTTPSDADGAQLPGRATVFGAVCHGPGALYAGSESGDVTTFHAESGQLLNRRAIQDSAVMDLGTVILPSGRMVVVQVSAGGLVAATDPTTGNDMWSRQLTPFTTWALATAQFDGGPVIIVPTHVSGPGASGKWWGCVLLDARTGAALQVKRQGGLRDLQLQTFQDKALTCVASTDIRESTVVAAGGQAKRVSLWSLSDLPGSIELPSTTDSAVAAVTFGAGVLLGGNLDGTLDCWDTSGWDPSTLDYWVSSKRRPAWTVKHAHPLLTCLTTTVAEGRPMVVTAGRDRAIRTWEIDGTSIGAINIDEEILSLDITVDGRCAVGTYRGVLELSL